MKRAIDIERYLDSEGRVKVWPSSGEAKQVVLTYLASKFELKTVYSEKEVNDILKKFHIFNDHALLRRELYDHRLLEREKDGSKYWLNGNAISTP